MGITDNKEKTSALFLRPTKMKLFQVTKEKGKEEREQEGNDRQESQGVFLEGKEVCGKRQEGRNCASF
jgi:hypothetical protein